MATSPFVPHWDRRWLDWLGGFLIAMTLNWVVLGLVNLGVSNRGVELEVQKKLVVENSSDDIRLEGRIEGTIEINIILTKLEIVQSIVVLISLSTYFYFLRKYSLEKPSTLSL